MGLEQNDNFGSSFRNFRKGLGLTQKALADKIDGNHSYISSIESGKTIPGKHFLNRVSKEFATDVERILNLKEVEEKGSSNKLISIESKKEKVIENKEPIKKPVRKTNKQNPTKSKEKVKSTKPLEIPIVEVKRGEVDLEKGNHIATLDLSNQSKCIYEFLVSVGRLPKGNLSIKIENDQLFIGKV